MLVPLKELTYKPTNCLKNMKHIDERWSKFARKVLFIYFFLNKILK
jgi:hypothetical protein